VSEAHASAAEGARLGIPMPRHATFKMNALLNREVLSGPLGASYGRSHPPVGQVDEQKPCSTGVWWAREELNLRPLPCQQTTGTAVLTAVLPGHLRP
jgi:hypothetical protein